MKIKHSFLSNAIVTGTVFVLMNLGLSGYAMASSSCGSGSNAINTSIDFGCKGAGNPIVDLTFAIIRFLSYGVGLVITFSLVVAGLQYIGSQGNSENTNNAISRIRSSIIALILYIFAFAILNYIVPGQVLK
jgi:hypothetical protein